MEAVRWSHPCDPDSWSVAEAPLQVAWAVEWPGAITVHPVVRYYLDGAREVADRRDGSEFVAVFPTLEEAMEALRLLEMPTHGEA